MDRNLGRLPAAEPPDKAGRNKPSSFPSEVESGVEAG